MKIVLFSADEAETASAVSALDPAFTVTSVARPIDAGIVDAYADADIVSGFAGCDFGAAILSRLPKLRFIAIRATGFDSVDLDYCRAHGIRVSNVPVYGDSTVAEHAIGLLLALSRATVPCAEATRRGDFAYTPARGFELRGKVFGVVGTGHIGRRAIEMAHGFGMAVIAYDARPSPALQNTPNVRYAPLDELLAQADIVSLHVPATPETDDMIGARQFALMKRGAVLINTARGQVVDNAALVRALESGHLAAAGLDVLPDETLLRHPATLFAADTPATPAMLRDILAARVLAGMPNVIVTPHNAYNTVEAFRRITATTAANIRAFVDGHPINLVS
ncbi:D-isomer specific 2-hydroxyacid dehydrogenase [Gluconacetobacter sacchari DSM 12717]|uniref:Hydroxyacid dehydrogenase n=2 Tax=Gluconacetobacter sacchari TaxID=92759 RepID=A0A7W4IAH2_9PROT|nr:NAD(P)-dependent oxidoreductase [Gluconacetobacter sacchari]MBB2159294.1 hydroxyacid dehydrogenase [Gluconacetobacter sacchari]GBQ26753.1 D-isomer specific 2-hydroxyacid dehydrogenase [Gluconacetobacter sacchari DSM 12717]